MTDISNFTQINVENSDQQSKKLSGQSHVPSDVLKNSKVVKLNEKQCDTSYVTLNYVENQQNLETDVKINLLANEQAKTYEESPVNSVEPKKSENDKDDENDEEKEKQISGTSNFSLDYVKNAKKEDVKIELLAKEPPKEPEPETSEIDEDEEVIETPQMDPRFPNQNQTSHCWSAYIDFHRCVNLLGEEHEAAKYFKKTYTSMCPNSWVERWDEQRENGTFPAIIDRVKLEEDEVEEVCETDPKEDYEACQERIKLTKAENNNPSEPEPGKPNDKDKDKKSKENKDKPDDKDTKKKKGKIFFIW